MNHNKFRTEYIVVVLAAILAAVVLSSCLLCLVPPVSRDALIHHLAIPKLYLKKGAIYEIPEFQFSYYPMNLDLLYMIPLYFNNDTVPKFMHFSFALVTALLIFRYLSRRMNIRYALLGSIFFLTIPAIYRLSSVVYVDLGLICFLFASILSLLKWIESGFKTGRLAVSGFFCGLAIGVKYNGLIGLFLLAMFVPFVYVRYHRDDKSCTSKAAVNFIVFVATALLIFSPWMMRNYIWTGNIVYPLFDKALKDGSDHESDGQKYDTPLSMNHIEVRRKLFGESTWEIILIPVRVFFQGKDDDPRYFDGRSNPFLLLLPMFAFLSLKSDSRIVKTEKALFLYFSVLFLLFACAKTVIRIRYFAAVMPPLAILSMFGLKNILSVMLNSNISRNTGYAIVASIVFATIGINAAYMASLFDRVRPLEYILGKVSRDEYIRKYRPEYAAIQYANGHLSENDKILGIFLGNRGYYFDISVEFSITMMGELSARCEEPVEIYRHLREKNISHLMINYDLFNYWARKHSPREKKMLKDFLEKHTVTEFSADNYGLLRLIQG